MVESTNPKYKVIDASVVISKLMPDEKSPQEINNIFLQFVEGKIHLVAPNLIKYEVVNSLKSGLLQKRLSSNVAKNLLKKFLELQIIYMDVDFDKVLNLAIQKKISVYDASYLVIAKSNGWQLLTLDKKLASL